MTWYIYIYEKSSLRSDCTISVYQLHITTYTYVEVNLHRKVFFVKNIHVKYYWEVCNENGDKMNGETYLYLNMIERVLIHNLNNGRFICEVHAFAHL